MLIDFQNSFIDGFTSTFATKPLLITPQHLNCVTTLPYEIAEFKNCSVQDLSLWSKLPCNTQPLRTVVTIPYSDFSVT